LNITEQHSDPAPPKRKKKQETKHRPRKIHTGLQTIKKKQQQSPSIHPENPHKSKRTVFLNEEKKKQHKKNIVT
jgi:hypothetical protein